jgi:hypothetical protein
MPLLRLHSFVAITLLLPALHAGAQDISCQATHDFHDQGRWVMNAQLRLEQGQPVEVTLEHVTKLLSPLTGSTCRAHLGLGDAGSMWSIQGPLTHVSMPPDGTGKPSSMDIQAVKGGYVLKTTKLSHADCGARVE